MSYSIPPYIAAARIDTPTLDYVWDDTRGQEDFTVDTAAIVERLADLTLRAKIAMGIGMYEWVIWRFRSLSADPRPFQVAEAAWCANVDRKFVEYEEWDRREWTGPVRGPLWYATTWLMPMIFFSDDRPEEWESGLSLLSRLAFHVLPTPAPFEAWLTAIEPRMKALYTAGADDPFSDLFGEQEEVRRGPLLPREVLDPAFDFKPELAEPLMRRFFSDIDARQNPLIHSAEDLARGFRDS